MSVLFFDVDTQLDFLLPSGALYVPGAERIVPAIAQLNRHAAARGIPLVSTVDAHAENDPEFRAWPAHCVKGTLGQRKPESTVVPGQAIFEKTSTDAFADGRLDPLLAALPARQALVYGVVTEICVRHAAMGLLQRGWQVSLVADAVRELSASGRDEFLAAFTTAGGRVTTLAAAVSSSPASTDPTAR